MDNLTSSEKYRTISSWLKHILSSKSQSEEVPEFEINEQTLHTLYEMAKNSNEMEKQCQCLLDDLQQRLIDYKERGL